MYKPILEQQLKTKKSFAIPLWLKRNRKDILEWLYNETKQYKTKSIMEMVYIVLYGSPPKCSDNNDRIFNTFDKGYRIGCILGNKCSDVSKTRIEKQKETVFKKYGVTNTSKLVSVKEKIKNTNLKKYGVVHHSQNNIIKNKIINTKKNRKPIDDVQNKRINTSLMKYGVEHHMKLKSQQEKVKQTNIDRYGKEFPLQNATSVKKMRETYTKTHYIQDINNKRKQTILEKYGVDAASRINVLKSTLDIITNEDKFVQFVTNKTRDQVLSELKIHEHTLYLYSKKYNATHLFKRPLVSNFEKEICDFLNELNITYIQNDRYIISSYELDFYIPQYNFAIECCGLYWHSENSAGRDKHYHVNKFLKCKELNISLLTIFQDDWENQKEKIKNRIRIILNLPTEKIYGRNTTIRLLTKIETKLFLNNYHLQLYAPSTINLGLFHNNELCSIMTFGKSRYNKQYEYELIRYCSNKNVISGVSKLFKHFIKQYNPKSIISYSDNRYFTGNMYKTLNFTEQHTTVGYFYTNYHKKFNRLQFQKHKLVEQGYDKTKSEWQIMQELGYDRIWDCGQTAWTLILDK